MKKIINEFTKSFKLYFYSNAMYFVINIRYIFSVLINFTQFYSIVFCLCKINLKSFIHIFINK